MIKFLKTEYIFRVQKKVALWGIICCLIIIILNIAAFISVFPAEFGERIFNISTLTIMLILFIISRYNRLKIWQIYQVFIFTGSGLLNLVYGAELSYISSFVITFGLLLLYIYNYIKHFSYWHFLFIFIPLITIKIITNNDTINIREIGAHAISSIIAYIIILFVINIMHDELNLYMQESKKNDALIRAGLNVSGLYHLLNLKTEISNTRFIIKEINENKKGEAIQTATDLVDLLKDKDEICRSCVDVVKASSGNDPIEINLKKIFKSLLNLCNMDKKVFRYINFDIEFKTDNPTFYGIYHEIFFLIQNLVQNAINAIIQKSKKGKDTIKICIDKVETKNRKSFLTIFIQDTGIGFPKKFISNNDEIDLSLIRPHITNGFGLVYILDILQYYNGTIGIFSKQGIGTSIKISLPINK